MSDKICDEDVLIGFNKNTGTPVVSVNLESFGEERLDVSFTQNKVRYCYSCYNGIKDGNEEAIDCGGICRACRPEKILPLVFVIIALFIIASILLIPALKIGRSDQELARLIKELIKESETALKEEDRKRATDNFRKIKWLYIQIEGNQIKKRILKDIQKHRRKIKEFYEV